MPIPKDGQLRKMLEELAARYTTLISLSTDRKYANLQKWGSNESVFALYTIRLTDVLPRSEANPNILFGISSYTEQNLIIKRLSWGIGPA